MTFAVAQMLQFNQIREHSSQLVLRSPYLLDVTAASHQGNEVSYRSGLAVKNGINVGAGVIDEDYRGEVCVVLFNHSDQIFEVKKGNRIAQLILEKIMTPEIAVVDVF